MLQIDPSSYIFAAVLLLTLPLDWCICAVFAAVVHELCHIAAIYAVGGRIHAIAVYPGGAMIDASVGENLQSLLCILAGPAGSLLLLLLFRVTPKISLCAGIQGFFNLLPILPLDGGRALTLILELLEIEKAHTVQKTVELSIKVAVFVLAVWLSWRFSMGIVPIIAAIWLILGVNLRKRPCKRK